MLRRAAVLAALLGCAVTAMAEKNDIITKELSNGLKTALWENHRSKAVEIRIYIKAGSVYEQEYPGSGISHFLEHLTAEGPTLKKTKGEVDALMMKFGNVFNAYTSNGHTCYHMTTTREHYPEALELMGELVFENLITPEAFRREQGVIMREIEKSDEEPKKRLYKLSSENLYRVHPSRFPVIGYRELFAKLTLENIKDYYRKKYVPNNALLVVGGDIDAGKTADMIDRKYGAYERNFYEPPALPSEPDLTGIREKTGYMDIEGAYMMLDWLTIPIDHPNLYALDLLSEILTSGTNSRLVRILKEEKQMVNAVKTYSYTPEYGKGDFSVFIKTADPSSLYQAEREVLGIIKDVAEKGVTREELDKAKKLEVSDLLFSRTSVTGYTSRIGSDVISTGDAGFSGKYLENIKRVTSEDIRRVAARYLAQDRYSRAVLLGKTGDAGVTASGNNGQESEPEKIELENGMRIVLKRLPGTGVINYAVFIKGGATYDRVYDTPGLFRFYANMLSRGSGKYTRERLADEFERMGAEFSVSSGNNTLYLEAASLSEDYAKMTDLIRDIIFNPRFAQDEIEKARKLTLESIEQQKNDWYEEAYLNFVRHVFPSDSPYSQSIKGTAESVGGITSEKLRKIHGDFMVPSNIVISVAGDFEIAAMKEHLSRAFSGVKGAQTALPDYQAGALSPDKPVVRNYSTGKDLAVIFYGFPAATVFDIEDRTALEAVDVIMSGGSYPGGWLHDSLRGKELVYVVHGQNVNYIKAGCFFIYAATTAEKYKSTYWEIENAVQKMKSGKYTDKEIETAKNLIITEDLLARQTPMSQARDYALNEILGFGYDFERDYAEKIKNVTRKDIECVVKKYFRNPVAVITSPE
ncbi:MAG: insulinase family protein [Elusimicrobia bacterium]|nr:insulinase family protein [Elusimicrobiota bacterium]